MSLHATSSTAEAAIHQQQRIAYVINFSDSVRGTRNTLMRKELTKPEAAMASLAKESGSIFSSIGADDTVTAPHPNRTLGQMQPDAKKCRSFALSKQSLSDNFDSTQTA